MPRCGRATCTRRVAEATQDTVAAAVGAIRRAAATLGHWCQRPRRTVTWLEISEERSRANEHVSKPDLDTAARGRARRHDGRRHERAGGRRLWRRGRRVTRG